MKRLALVLGFVFVFSFTGFGATYFTGSLTSAQEVPPNGSTATGFGRVTLNDAETQITVSVHWTGLTGNASAGHIHGPAAVGTNAGILFNLSPAAAATGSVIGATFAVTPTQVANLKAGLWYFNIHTATNPGGEIRGQITVDSPYVAYFSNRQEVPASTASGATGSGAVSIINSAGTQALVSMTWAGLSGNASAGHIHSGRSGVNGAVVCNLSPPAVAAGSVTDFLCSFSPTQIAALRQGQFYFNIHTSANPGGEIRGQIQRRRSTGLDFDGDSKTDFAVARDNSPSGGLVEWFILNSATSGFTATQWGQSSDFVSGRLMAGDWDGDGKDDITIWRSAVDANFLILRSSDFTLRVERFGSAGDDPRMNNDYDGDGRTDAAVWRTGAQALLYYRPSSNPTVSFVGIPWGTSGDFPNPGDFDGDGRADICVQRGTNWYCLNTTQGFRAYNWGLSSDFGAPGDYDGDGKVDILASRTDIVNRIWFPLRSLDGQFQAVTWGTNVALRTQGDYDGDGKTDFAVWQNVGGVSRAFFVLPANGNPFFAAGWGIDSDIAINAYNVR